MNGVRKKVFFVDDDRLIIMSMKGVVMGAGFDVESFWDGPTAWEKIQKSPPDIIILDAVMPVLNGFEITRRMKADEKLKKIPVLILTGLKSPQDTFDAKQAGADEVLAKPITGDKLIERIRFHLKKPAVA